MKRNIKRELEWQGGQNRRSIDDNKLSRVRGEVLASLTKATSLPYDA